MFALKYLKQLKDIKNFQNNEKFSKNCFDFGCKEGITNKNKTRKINVKKISQNISARQTVAVL